MVTLDMHLCINCAVLKLYFWKLYWLRIYILTVTIHWVDSNNVSKINSLWPGDAIWRHVTRSTLDQVMACCLTAPSLNQCWLIMGEAPWHSSQDIILIRCEDTNQQNKIENCNFKWYPGHNECKRRHCTVYGNTIATVFLDIFFKLKEFHWFKSSYPFSPLFNHSGPSPCSH